MDFFYSIYKSSNRLNWWIASLLGGLLMVVCWDCLVFGMKPAAQSERLQDRLVSQLNLGDEEQRLDALVHIATYLCDSATFVSQQTIAALEKILRRDASSLNRALAAHAFELIAEEQSSPVLLASLASEREVSVRKAIIYALARQRSAQITSTLIPLLDDKNSEIRASAAFALAEIGDPSSADALIELLRKRGKEEDSFARSQAVRAIGEFGKVDSISILLNILVRDKSSEVRREAAKSLGSIDMTDDPRVEKALRSALTSEDPYLVAAAEASLAKIKFRSP